MRRESAPHERSPLLFIVLVFLLSIPFWVIGARYHVELLPGLPLSAIMVICPLAAALILIARASGSAGVLAHLKRSFDYPRIQNKVWYIPIVLLQPAVALLSNGVMRMLGMPLPTPQLALTTALVLFVLFFISAIGEESGWSGYLIDPLQERWGALNASIVLGMVWAVWHVLPLVQVGRAPSWIACNTWLYNNTARSIFGAILFHAMTNLSWQLFPNDGSHYDPRLTGLIVTTVAVLVVLRWGARTLAARETT